MLRQRSEEFCLVSGENGAEVAKYNVIRSFDDC